MVSVAHLRADAENLLYEIEQRSNELEENASLYFVAARHTQRIFRGHVTRKHAETLKEMATCIQKNWRAFLGRLTFHDLLLEKYDELCRSRYETSAVTIQRHWKGYCERNRIFNYYKLKSWLEFVKLQNVYLKCTSKRYRAAQNKIEVEQRENESKEWMQYILFKLHHLLRTHQITGVYSLPKTSSLSDIEKMLKCLRYKDFMTFYNTYKSSLREEKGKETPAYILQRCKYAAHFEKEWHEHRLAHKDSYVESSQPIDRYTRYERRDDQADAVRGCSCTFCTSKP